MKKLVVVLAAAVAVGIAVPIAFAGGGAQVTNSCPNAGAPNPVTGLPNCQYSFVDGNGAAAIYNPAAFHDVVTPSGNETETFKGPIANDTGHAVIHTPTSGAPIPAGQTCYSFVTNNVTPDWQLTISGNFSLDCHFSKP